MVRRVRGNNVTFVDRLEEWGFSKESMEELAKVFRRQFSASVSVTEREGGSLKHQKGPGGKPVVLWTLRVQGKYLEQVARALRERGVLQVEGQSTKAVRITKKDQQVNV